MRRFSYRTCSHCPGMTDSTVALGYKHGPLSLAPGMTDSMVALGYKHGPLSLAPGMRDSMVALGYKNMTPSVAPQYVLQHRLSSKKAAAVKASHDRAKPARRAVGNTEDLLQTATLIQTTGWGQM